MEGVVYNRNARGEWFRNGKSVAEHRVPFKVRRLAYYMTPECTIKTRGYLGKDDEARGAGLGRGEAKAEEG